MSSPEQEINNPHLQPDDPPDSDHTSKLYEEIFSYDAGSQYDTNNAAIDHLLSSMEDDKKESNEPIKTDGKKVTISHSSQGTITLSTDDKLIEGWETKRGWDPNQRKQELHGRMKECFEEARALSGFSINEIEHTLKGDSRNEMVSRWRDKLILDIDERATTYWRIAKRHQFKPTTEPGADSWSTELANRLDRQQHFDVLQNMSNILLDGVGIMHSQSLKYSGYSDINRDSARRGLLEELGTVYSIQGDLLADEIGSYYKQLPKELQIELEFARQIEAKHAYRPLPQDLRDRLDRLDKEKVAELKKTPPELQAIANKLLPIKEEREKINSEYDTLEGAGASKDKLSECKTKRDKLIEKQTEIENEIALYWHKRMEIYKERTAALEREVRSYDKRAIPPELALQIEKTRKAASAEINRFLPPNLLALKIKNEIGQCIYPSSFNKPVDYKRAEALQQELVRRNNGQENQDTATILGMFGDRCKLDGNLKEAANYYVKYIKIQTELSQENSIETAKVTAKLAEVNEDNPRIAKLHYNKALIISSQYRHGNFDRDTNLAGCQLAVYTANQYASYLARLGGKDNDEKAKEIYKLGNEIALESKKWKKETEHSQQQ